MGSLVMTLIVPAMALDPYNAEPPLLTTSIVFYIRRHEMATTRFLLRLGLVPHRSVPLSGDAPRDQVVWKCTLDADFHPEDGPVRPLVQSAPGSGGAKGKSRR